MLLPPLSSSTESRLAQSRHALSFCFAPSPHWHLSKSQVFLFHQLSLSIICFLFLFILPFPSPTCAPSSRRPTSPCSLVPSFRRLVRRLNFLCSSTQSVTLHSHLAPRRTSSSLHLSINLQTARALSRQEYTTTISQCQKSLQGQPQRVAVVQLVEEAVFEAAIGPEIVKPMANPKMPTNQNRVK